MEGGKGCCAAVRGRVDGRKKVTKRKERHGGSSPLPSWSQERLLLVGGLSECELGRFNSGCCWRRLPSAQARLSLHRFAKKEGGRNGNILREKNYVAPSSLSRPLFSPPSFLSGPSFFPPRFRIRRVKSRTDVYERGLELEWGCKLAADIRPILFPSFPPNFPWPRKGEMKEVFCYFRVLFRESVPNKEYSFNFIHGRSQLAIILRWLPLGVAAFLSPSFSRAERERWREQRASFRR